MAKGGHTRIVAGAVLSFVAAIAAAAYAQSVEGPAAAPTPRTTSTEPRDLEEFALALKTRERLLQRQENTGITSEIAEAERRLDERLEQLRLLREEIGVQIAAIHEQRLELAQKYGEVEVLRKQLLTDLEQKRSTVVAELDSKRSDILGGAEAKNKDDVAGLVEMIESMRANEAAAVLAQVDSALAVTVLERMSRMKAGKALAQMAPPVAAALAEKMAIKPSYENLGLATPDALLGGSGLPPQPLTQPTTLGADGSGVAAPAPAPPADGAAAAPAPTEGAAASAAATPTGTPASPTPAGPTAAAPAAAVPAPTPGTPASPEKPPTGGQP